MTTATKINPLTELERVEAEWTAASEKASTLGRELSGKLARQRELSDQRQRLRHREPGLFTHEGNPNPSIRDNPAQAIDNELTKLGDVNDLSAQVDHARRLEERAKRTAHEFIAANFPALIRAMEPQAEAAVERVDAALGEARTALDAYIELVQRIAGLTAPVHSFDGRDVPGLEEAGGLRGALDGWSIPLPLPVVG